ncbi:ZIP Zinc transporter [Nesidiocoris tenuis]|uniref:ZIP Zinc transporter n=1 Tax=Nesidiocoris tenuis TaxID=355587 RepID=A0ABN7B9R9_9HEMI|nr:ZIP Zinc transporter [Nesidiocoris tenuis]
MISYAVIGLLSSLCVSCAGATNLSAAAGVLQMAPCSAVNRSTAPCISSNNCSGRQATESCQLVLSVPPQDVEKTALEGDVIGGGASNFEVWMMGCLSVGIISLSGITGAVLWPLLKSPYYPHLMTALIGLAVGSLSSTALFQLIPEAFQIPEYDTSLTYLNTALAGWFSIWVIYFIEGVSKIVFRKPSEEETKKRVVSVEWNGTDESLQLKGQNDYVAKCHDALVDKHKTKVSAVAWMIIFGDGIHNFIDGVTIGAGYSQSIGTGIGLSLAIACEEFPHELGDFAILLQSGMSLKKAMCYNFLSACTAFLGLILGILLGQLEGAHYIFAFAGSLFLYISLGHLIPELKGDIKKSLTESRSRATLFFVLQNIGILTGSCIMYTITKHNEAIANLF